MHFNENENLGDVLDRGELSQLTGYFYTCATDPNAREHTYADFPLHYSWGKSSKTWKRRTRRAKVVSRMYTVSLREGERYFLRALLSHVAGATSYEYLRTYESVQYETFRQACVARGLLQDDDEWLRCLNEAAVSNMPRQFRPLFATVLVHGRRASCGLPCLITYALTSLIRTYRDLSRYIEQSKMSTVHWSLLADGGIPFPVCLR